MRTIPRKYIRQIDSPIQSFCLHQHRTLPRRAPAILQQHVDISETLDLRKNNPLLDFVPFLPMRQNIKANFVFFPNKPMKKTFKNNMHFISLQKQKKRNLGGAAFTEQLEKIIKSKINNNSHKLKKKMKNGALL